MTNLLNGENITFTTNIQPEWMEWIAENALRGADVQTLVSAMVDGGIERSLAEREVIIAMNHPYLKAAAPMVGDAPAPVTAPAGGATLATKYAWFLEVRRRAARLGADYGTVPRVKKPSKQAFLDEFYSQNRPCIIEGAIDDWPALTKWNAEYLKAKCGDATVEVQANRNDDSDYEKNAVKHKKEMKFGEFVDIVESGVETNDWYITANNSGLNKQSLLPLWDDISMPEYLVDPHDNGNGFFWYGPAGTVTPIHHDLTNNFMAQVRGRKRIKLIAPYESMDVYNDHHCFSPVDIENPDLEKFPAMANVNVIDVEIGPGDLFFLPVGWWHGVRGLELSITMTFTNFVYDNDFFSFYTTYDEIA